MNWDAYSRLRSLSNGLRRRIDPLTGARFQVERALVERARSESGRRESNPRSQLGKIAQPDPTNSGEPEPQVSEPADLGEPPRTDPDAP